MTIVLYCAGRRGGAPLDCTAGGAGQTLQRGRVACCTCGARGHAGCNCCAGAGVPNPGAAAHLRVPVCPCACPHSWVVTKKHGDGAPTSNSNRAMCRRFGVVLCGWGACIRLPLLHHADQCKCRKPSRGRPTPTPSMGRRLLKLTGCAPSWCGPRCVVDMVSPLPLHPQRPHLPLWRLPCTP